MQTPPIPVPVVASTTRPVMCTPVGSTVGAGVGVGFGVGAGVPLPPPVPPPEPPDPVPLPVVPVPLPAAGAEAAGASGAGEAMTTAIRTANPGSGRPRSGGGGVAMTATCDGGAPSGSPPSDELRRNRKSAPRRTSAPIAAAMSRRRERTSLSTKGVSTCTLAGRPRRMRAARNARPSFTCIARAKRASVGSRRTPASRSRDAAHAVSRVRPRLRARRNAPIRRASRSSITGPVGYASIEEIHVEGERLPRRGGRELVERLHGGSLERAERELRGRGLGELVAGHGVRVHAVREDDRDLARGRKVGERLRRGVGDACLLGGDRLRSAMAERLPVDRQRGLD